MGGTVIETESDKIKIQMIIELGKEDGLDDVTILKRLQKKIIGLPLNGQRHIWNSMANSLYNFAQKSWDIMKEDLWI